MSIKELFRDVQLKKAALILAEQQRRLKESPGDDLLFAQVVGMTQMAYEILNDYDLKIIYDYYCLRLDQPVPKPGEKVLYYDPSDRQQPKLARVVESSEWPKWVRVECDDTTFDVTDRDVDLFLYW